MKLNAYSVYDVSADIYMRPFFAISDGEVMRDFGDVCCDKDHAFGKHPEDYTLMRIGTWNDSNGQFEPETPVKITTALERVAAARQIRNDLAPEDLQLGGTA